MAIGLGIWPYIGCLRWLFFDKLEDRSLGGKSAAAPDGKSFRFVCACDARLVYLMSDRKEILGVLGFYLLCLGSGAFIFYLLGEGPPPPQTPYQLQLTLWIS